MPALEASTGSLGQGVSLALGMALAARLDERAYRTYVMLGDGEIQEGQIWEARHVRRLTTRWTTSAPSSTTTASSSMASSRTSWRWSRSPTSGAPSAGTPSKWTATTSRRFQQAFDEAAGHQGQAHRPRRPHRQRARACRSWRTIPSFTAWRPPPQEVQLALAGASINGDQNQVRTQDGGGHARGLRQNAGRTGPRKSGHRGAAMRTSPSPPRPRCSPRSSRSASSRAASPKPTWWRSPAGWPTPARSRSSPASPASS